MKRPLLSTHSNSMSQTTETCPVWQLSTSQCTKVSAGPFLDCSYIRCDKPVDHDTYVAFLVYARCAEFSSFLHRPLFPSLVQLYFILSLFDWCQSFSFYGVLVTHLHTYVQYISPATLHLRRYTVLSCSDTPHHHILLQLYIHTAHMHMCCCTRSSSSPSHPARPTDRGVPPTADAGPDVHIFLPQHVVCLNGSGSHDDFGIVSYKWNRSDDSPAAGVSWHSSKYCG